jgi:hypothetical protein
VRPRRGWSGGRAMAGRAGAETPWSGAGAVAAMATRREHGGGRRGNTKPREEGGGGGRGREDRGSPRMVGRRRRRWARLGWGRGGRARWGGEDRARGGLGKGEGEGNFGRQLPGGPHMAGRRRLQPPADGAARAGARRLGREGRGAGRSWAAKPAQGGGGGAELGRGATAGPPSRLGRARGGAGWADRKPAQKRGFPFYFPFPIFHNLLLSAFFMETKQILLRKRCVVQHDATTKENISRVYLHEISSRISL